MAQIKCTYSYGKHQLHTSTTGTTINYYSCTPNMITDDKFDKRSDIPIDPPCIEQYLTTLNNIVMFGIII